MSTYNYPQVHLFLPVSMSFVTDFLMLCHFFSPLQEHDLLSSLTFYRVFFHHWPFLFRSAMAACEVATQRAIRAWSATLSCHVVSAAPFVLINCWEKCVTSCQADCWCPSGHPSMPGARWCYCGSAGHRGEEMWPCRMWDNTGKEEEGIPELCAEARSAGCLWEHSPVTPSNPTSLEDRLCHPLHFAWPRNETTDCFLSSYSAVLFIFNLGVPITWLASEALFKCLYLAFIRNIEPLNKWFMTLM